MRTILTWIMIIVSQVRSIIVNLQLTAGFMLLIFSIIQCLILNSFLIVRGKK